jgi:hypothetical protein
VAREPYGLVPPHTINPREVVNWQAGEHLSDPITRPPPVPQASPAEIEARAKELDGSNPKLASYLRDVARQIYLTGSFR